MIETDTLPELSPGRLHDAEALAIYGERAEAYVRGQVMTKAFEAIGLSSLSVSYRDVDPDGTVIDFDGRPMRCKLAAACGTEGLPEFEIARRQTELANLQLIEQWLAAGRPGGSAVLEISPHPNVPDRLAAITGYHPVDRFVMQRRYSLENNQLVLRNFNKAGSNPGQLLRQHHHFGGTLPPDSTELDILANPLPISVSLEEVLGVYDPDGDYGHIEAERLRLERAAADSVNTFMIIAANIGQRCRDSLLPSSVAETELEKYERGLMTLLMVKLNPERARFELSDEDFQWMQLLLDFDPGDTILVASRVADRNQLMFIACGGVSMAERLGQNEWHGGQVKYGKCANCHQTREVGVASWCRVCIKGHCG